MLKELIGIAAVAAVAGIAGYAIAKKEDEENCDCHCDDCNFFDEDCDCDCENCDHITECLEHDPESLDRVAPKFTHIDDEGREVDNEKEDAKSNTETTDDTLPY